jgi:hypothetical protein
MPAANKPIKPMRIKVFCLAKVMMAHGFTGNVSGKNNLIRDRPSKTKCS